MHLRLSFTDTAITGTVYTSRNTILDSRLYYSFFFIVLHTGISKISSVGNAPLF